MAYQPFNDAWIQTMENMSHKDAIEFLSDRLADKNYRETDNESKKAGLISSIFKNDDLNDLDSILLNEQIPCSESIPNN